ncbi:glycoside hydrolase family 5 protein [Roseibium sp.]|uniref:glycoside hydrolase family 5 protein n=1 Tax=Roseibium sp. TaxID=1936156 RepID=UPI003266D824
MVNDPIRMTALAAAAVWMLQLPAEAGPAAVCYKGVNLSGAEYGVDTDNVYGTNYIYPSERTVKYFAETGMNIVRLPFRWERLQPVFGRPLEAMELKRLKEAVELLRAYDMTVVLNPHNFGYYDGKRMMTPDLPAQVFADFWIRLALEFAGDADIVFGLMNEPYDIPAEDWLSAVNQAITGIRAVGADNLVLVPGTNWSGATSWLSDRPGGNNSRVMSGVVDPAGNFAYEVHQYMDEDYSGTHETCPKAAGALEGLERFTGWLAEQGAKGFLGEFGGSKDPACLAGLTDMVRFMDANPDRWVGWTYWAAGEWWPQTEGNNIQPVDGKDRAQLTELMPNLQTIGDQACETIN